MLKSNISVVYSHKNTGIKINDDLPLEKTLNMHNPVILVKSVFNNLKIIILWKRYKKNI